MRTMIVKWVYRCLGWILIGCVAVAALSGYILHKRKGYGTMELRVTWRDKALPVDQMAGGDCELVVRGKRVAWTAGKGVRLRPGSAVAELRVRGFRACSASVGVTKDTATVAEFRLEAEPRTITVNNVKSNGVVNGKPSGGTWVLQGAEVGRSYAVEVAAPGFHTNLLSLQIEKPGEDLVTNLVWEPLVGFVSVRVTPGLPGTAAAIDGVPLSQEGSEPLRVGMHSLTVSNGDYYPRAIRVEVKNGCTTNCEIILDPRPALLSVEVTPEVSYQLRDESGKVLTLESGIATLAPGSNILYISASNYATQQRQFLMEANRSYSWPVTLEKEGVERFRSAQAEFQTLIFLGANGSVLDRYGGPEWERIRNTSWDTNSLARGAQQYRQAIAELGPILEKCRTSDKLQRALLEEFERQRAEFVKRLDSAAQYPVLNNCQDWLGAKTAEFDSIDPAKGARQYKEACDHLDAIMKTIPQRQALLDSAVGMQKKIGELARWRTGDDAGWARDLNSAEELLGEYWKQFGEGTQYEKWFGGVANWVGRFKGEINYEWKLLPKYQKQRKYKPTS